MKRTHILKGMAASLVLFGGIAATQVTRADEGDAVDLYQTGSSAQPSGDSGSPDAADVFQEGIDLSNGLDQGLNPQVGNNQPGSDLSSPEPEIIFEIQDGPQQPTPDPSDIIKEMNNLVNPTPSPVPDPGTDANHAPELDSWN